MVDTLNIQLFPPAGHLQPVHCAFQNDYFQRTILLPNNLESKWFLWAFCHLTRTTYLRFFTGQISFTAGQLRSKWNTGKVSIHLMWSLCFEPWRICLYLASSIIHSVLASCVDDLWTLYKQRLPYFLQPNPHLYFLTTLTCSRSSSILTGLLARRCSRLFHNTCIHTEIMWHFECTPLHLTQLIM